MHPFRCLCGCKQHRSGHNVVMLVSDTASPPLAPDFVTPELIAEILDWPTRTRRLFYEKGRREFSTPVDYRDDSQFYPWVIRFIKERGLARHRDVLREVGGKNGNRNLMVASVVWGAKRLGILDVELPDDAREALAYVAAAAEKVDYALVIDVSMWVMSLHTGVPALVHDFLAERPTTAARWGAYVAALAPPAGAPETPHADDRSVIQSSVAAGAELSDQDSPPQDGDPLLASELAAALEESVSLFDEPIRSAAMSLLELLKQAKEKAQKSAENDVLAAAHGELCDTVASLSADCKEALELDLDEMVASGRVHSASLENAGAAIAALTKAQEAFDHLTSARTAVAAARLKELGAANQAVQAALDAWQQSVGETQLILADLTRPGVSEGPMGGEADPTSEQIEEGPALDRGPELPSESLVAAGPAEVPEGEIEEEPEQSTENPQEQGVGTGATSMLLDEKEDSTPAVASDPQAPWDQWLLRSLSAGRPGLAMYAARARDFLEGENGGIAALALDGLITGQAVEAAFDRAAERYTLLQHGLTKLADDIDGEEDIDCAHTLLLFAGALRPTMVPPVASGVLSALKFGGSLNGLWPLAEVATRIGKTGGISAIVELRRSADHDDPKAVLSHARDALDQWYDTARRRTTSYAPATGLWQVRLMAPNGTVGGVVAQIRANSGSASASIRKLSEKLRDDVDTFIDEEFASYAGPRKRGVEALARQQLTILLKEARDQLDAWLRAQAVAAAPKDDRLGHLQQQLADGLHSARTCLKAIVADGGRTWKAAAAILVEGLVADLEAYLFGDGASVRSLDEWMDADLLQLPGFHLNGRHEIALDGSDVASLLQSCLALPDAALPTIDAAIRQKLAEGAVGDAERLARIVSRDTSLDPALENELVERTSELRADFSQQLVSLREQLDDLQTAAMAGTAVDAQLEVELALLEDINIDELPRDNPNNELDAIADFPALRSRFASFANDLEARRLEVAALFAEEIDVLERGGRDTSELRMLLEAGDLGTLAEELAQAKRHGDEHDWLTPEARLQPLRHLSHEVLPAMGDKQGLLRQTSKLIEAARTGTALGPLQFDCLAPDERLRAEQLLTGWSSLKRMSADLNRAKMALKPFLEELGFTSVEVDKPSGDFRGFRMWPFKADTLRSSETCIIPAFGSRAAGSYMILLAQKDSHLANIVANRNELGARPHFIFVMDTISDTARRSFLRQARGRSDKPLALLDEATVNALAATRGRTLRHLFDLTVPYGSACPYDDQAAATSPEMFFGRKAELAEVINPHGSCLVFGGRQLGKTALLKQAQVQLRGRAGQAVAYVVIQHTGDTSVAESVWTQIATELRREGTDGLKTIGSSDTRHVADELRDWLAGGIDRRLLILLDEADAFLESEIENNYPNIGIMKRLMEDTDRRAKFVFAGLHNVQRFAKSPNSPLLHLGMPINVGPLYGTERLEARRMAFDPMAGVGISFERPSDAAHMLSLVGYYPSLVQTFGKSLLTHVNKQAAVRGEATQLPLEIRRDDIAACFQDAAFRAELVRKFKATLNLDPRYELITYAICWQTDEDRQAGNYGGGGYSDVQIRDLARGFWPQGFTGDDSLDAFQALLDEMVGLGVLTALGASRYALRSGRIAAMLGGPEQITARLEEFMDLGPPERRDPLSNHRILPTGERSPFSLRREQAIAASDTNVIVVTGSESLGIEQVHSALASLAEDQRWPMIGKVTPQTLEGLKDTITSKFPKGEAGPHMLVVDPQWSPEGWAQKLAHWPELAQRGVRVVLLHRPLDLAASLKSGVDATSDPAITSLDLEPLTETAVRHWLRREAPALSEDDAHVRKVCELTGCVPSVLDSVKLPQSSRVDAAAALSRVEAAAQAAATGRGILAETGLDQPLFRELAVALNEHAGGDTFTLETAQLVSLIQTKDTLTSSSDGMEPVQALKRLGIIQAAGVSHEGELLRINPFARAVLSVQTA